MKIHFRFVLSHVKLTETLEKYSFIEFYYRFYCGKRANVGALPMTSQTNCDVSAYQNASLRYVIH